MKVLALSDIHGRFEKFPVSEMPEADVVVIAGDITTRGIRDTQEFRASEQWVKAVVSRYEMTFWIPGNHDLQMPPDVYYPIGEVGYKLISLLDRTVNFGDVSFFGVALSTAYDMPELASQWAYMTTRREVEEAAFAQIPHGTDVVVSHSPPWLILDKVGYTRNPDGTWEKRSIGSVALRRHIEKHQPKAVICGHVHGAAGHVRYGATDIYNVAEEWRLIEVEK